MRLLNFLVLLAALPFVGLAGACGSAETVTDTQPPPSCAAIIQDLTDTVPDPPDGANECASGACNYQTQEGCGDDEACRPQFNAVEPEVEPGCEPAGAAEAGEACALQSDCVRGTYCALNLCRKLCCGADWSACDAGESCIRQLEVKAGGEVISANVDLCFPIGTCDLFDPESCADEPGRECKIVDPTGAIACAPVSDAGIDDPCGPPDVCSQGLNCVGGYCVKLCLAEACGEPGCLESEGSCVHFQRDPPGVGECTLGR